MQLILPPPIPTLIISLHIPAWVGIYIVQHEGESWCRGHFYDMVRKDAYYHIRQALCSVLLCRRVYNS